MPSNLLEELGVDPERFEWTDLSLCRGYNAKSAGDDVFFDAYEADEEIARATDAMCIHCPVISQCFFAGSKGEYGVWGGVYWNGAGTPDKNKNAHKTEDIWDEIRTRVSGS